MKKAIVFITLITSVFLLTACFAKEEPTKESSERESSEKESNENNLVEDAVNSLLGKFELYEGTVTMEHGETFTNENIKEYVIAGDYENISIDDSHAYPTQAQFKNKETFQEAVANGELSYYVVFTNSDSEELKMYINWQDTLAPTIEATTCNLYTMDTGLTNLTNVTNDHIVYMNDVANHWLYSKTRYDFDNNVDIYKAPERIVHDQGQDEELYFAVYITRFSCSNGYEYTCKDVTNTKRQREFEEANNQNSLSVGEYTATITLEDGWHNSATYDIIINVINDLHPDDREALKKLYSLTDEEIDALVEEQK